MEFLNKISLKQSKIKDIKFLISLKLRIRPWRTKFRCEAIFDDVARDSESLCEFVALVLGLEWNIVLEFSKKPNICSNRLYDVMCNEY